MNLNDESYYDEVIQHLIIFLIAGQDTTGSLIEMCLYYLAELPQYQTSILDSLSKEPNVHTNKTLNNFIQEVLRLNGPLPSTLMRVVVEPFSIDGFEFKKGDILRQWFGANMTNVKYFDNPLKFDPDRWNKPLEYPHSFMPFSSGPRNCIGQHMSLMEVRVAVVSILRKYRLERTALEVQMHLSAFLNLPKHHGLVEFHLRT